jgi:hypothetical protein
MPSADSRPAAGRRAKAGRAAHAGGKEACHREKTLVHEVMTTTVVTVGKAMPFRHLVTLLYAKGISAVPVTGPGGHVLGVVSNSDLTAKAAGLPAATVGPQLEFPRRRRERRKARAEDFGRADDRARCHRRPGGHHRAGGAHHGPSRRAAAGHLPVDRLAGRNRDPVRPAARLPASRRGNPR